MNKQALKEAYDHIHAANRLLLAESDSGAYSADERQLIYLSRHDLLSVTARISTLVQWDFTKDNIQTTARHARETK